ncbi:MAG TPA: hypothetical protein VE641_10575, partial [Chthoniobacterales bacterium]|nr:hypothetical protein [Chthoniobacterales bacterium]
MYEPKSGIVTIPDRTYRTERLKTGAEQRKVEADSARDRVFRPTDRNSLNSSNSFSSGERRPWSLVTRLAVYYTLSAAVLLVVAMSILYLVVVQHINTADSLFLADTLRAVQADLADKRTINNELLADEVPPGTSDYFVRVLDPNTKEMIAEQPQIGDRLPPVRFPEPLSEHRIPTGGLEYQTPNGHWFLLMSASAILNSNSPKPVLIQVAQDRSDDKEFT